jgi:hypothetical protein
MDYDSNAFTQGVSPGGLRNTAQIKLLVEYLVSRLDEPLTADVAVEALTKHMLANYFESVQAVDELVANGSLMRDENGVLSLTEKGRRTLAEIGGELPASVRERALADAAAVLMRKKLEGTTDTKIEQTDDGCNVTCKVLHKDKVLLSVTLHAVDYEQAEKIADAFNSDPAGIYGSIISLF